ncbi:hypothetical protein Syun_008104 [Stephania yunnanensis]|uniref:Phospholipid/glycerol acyltransferase domain-containing protein n=1 Tax=Stephania yunnanensis TaxID=152371 RepID=A0AAP0L148_9MAGN
MVAGMAFYFKSILDLLSKVIQNNSFFARTKGSNTHSFHSKDEANFHPLGHTGLSDLSKKNVIFDVEGVLLKSSSMFPYFMLVAFEAGGLLRALVFLLLYPVTWMAGEEMQLKIMVMVCFCGLKRESFKVGRSVLPKFFLEDVGVQGFEFLMKFRKKVGVSKLPKVMVEEFMTEYLQMDFVVGRELKVLHGYYVGLMEDRRKFSPLSMNEMLGEPKMECDIDFIGLGYSKDYLDLYSFCKEIHFTNEIEKREWQTLPREKYPKPLIFHDGRLAFKPTPVATLAMLMWIPFGVILFIYRVTVGIYLPYNTHPALMSLSGMKLNFSEPSSFYPSIRTTNKDKNKESKHVLYVCNHKTLLDPVFVAACVEPPIKVVTYGISRISKIISPIRTIGLTREREKDACTMKKLLSEGGVIVCPEGTTCREPYLLRFSPMFVELSVDEMVPMAIDVKVSMFYGTTVSGFKGLDPIFLLMNPFLTYSITRLHKRSGASNKGKHGESLSSSSFQLANEIQGEIGEALGFECTNLTRKDKYRFLLAGNKE